MALNLEWQHRILGWRQELSKHIYQPLGELKLEAAFTFKQLTLDEALTQLDYVPIAPETPWGAKWEYGWFRGEVRIPEFGEGQMIAVMPDVGIEPTMIIEIIDGKVTPILSDTVAEAVVYVNGEYAGAIDHKHKVIHLTDSAQVGETFSIALEAYAGHGPVSGMPADPPERETVPEPPDQQCKVGQSHFWYLDGTGLSIADGC